MIPQRELGLVHDELQPDGQPAQRWPLCPVTVAVAPHYLQQQNLRRGLLQRHGDSRFRLPAGGAARGRQR